jgi:hypothetical protein
MNLEITCLEGNFSDDGFMKCIGGEWVSVGDDDKSGEIIPLECDGDGDGSCPGCLVADKCYTIGYRKAGEYCSDDLDFVSQVAADESCVNNFECNSNVCVSGECISAGFVEQILSWFRGLFS